MRKPEGAPADRASTTPLLSMRRAYHPPKLVEYGNVGKLTQGSSGTHPESGGHMLGCL
jgi:hypothetical protein